MTIYPKSEPVSIRKFIIKYKNAQPKGQFIHRRHDSMRHNPFFSLPIQSNGSVDTYAAQPSLVVTTKSCCNKNCPGSDFCHSIKKLLKKTASIGISPGFINL